ncbi:solute carrier family 12 member 1-like isoform X2 [Gordionus sp. m RMFG-2023]
MISRSLGPEFGGAIGVVFSIASTVAVSMNVVGLAETVVDLISKHGPHLLTIISAENWIRIVGCITAMLLLIIVIAGMEWESKAQVAFLILLLLAFLDYFLGTVLPIPNVKKAKGLLGYQGGLLKENFFSDFHKGASFFSIFAIYFPSATGILAGANISGDLKDAQKAIPKGTFTAILITATSYIFMIWTFGSVMLRDASGDMKDLFDSNNSIPLSTAQLIKPTSHLRLCGKTGSCKYGLLNDYQAAEMISYVGPIITAGIFSATLSSALACLVGASKVFQALCRDKIFPKIHVLAVGSKKNDDPYRIYILSFAIAVLFILIGDLNIIAPIISNFYLMAYALINYSCFDASLSNSLGFRPGFKYFNPWVSLIGGFLCVISMFLIKWWATVITFVFIIVLYGYIRYKKPDVNWGSSTQAHVYKNALTFLYKLNQTEEHVKNFRPQILALTGDPRTRPTFLDFANLFTKNLSLLICGHVIINSSSDCLLDLNTPNVYEYFRHKRIKAIYNPIIAPNLKDGVRALLQLSGLGRMRPNLLLMGYLNDCTPKNLDILLCYFNIIHDAFDLYLCVGILRMPMGLSLPTRCSFAQTSPILSQKNDISPERDNKIMVPNSTYQKSLPSNSITSLTSIASNNIIDSVKFHKHKKISKARPLSFVGGQFVVKRKLSNKSKLKNLYHKCSPKFERAKELPDNPSKARKSANKISRKKKFSRAITQFYHSNHPKDIRGLRLYYDNYFRVRHKRSTIDVWWLFDDGGLTILLPYIISQRRNWQHCKVRFFALSKDSKESDLIHHSFAAMLNKFRIDFSDVFIIPDIEKLPYPTTQNRFENMVRLYRVKDDDDPKYKPGMITDAEYVSFEQKSFRHMRLQELLQKHSKEASLIVITLPIPRKGTCSATLYMSWLEIMTQNLPPTLMIRGNQQSVLTFYS